MAKKIAVSGSAGTGKTTLAKLLADSLSSPYLEEGFRRRRESGFDPHSINRDQHRDLLVELYDEHLQDAQNCPTGFVQDRSPLDYLAFWLHYGFWAEEDRTQALFDRVRTDLKNYDLIVMLPWGALELEADGIRSTNMWLQLKYQALLEGLVHRFGLGPQILWMPKDQTDLDHRLNNVLASVKGSQ